MFLLLNAYCSATWYQGSAQQYIGTINFEKTRADTIKNAIANAVIKSNSFIQVEDIVLDGLLQSSKTIIRSDGQIRRVKILNETIDGDVLSIIVHVDIKPIESCRKDPYAKSLLITQFPLLKPNQASHGALFDFDSHVSKRFEAQLNSQPSVAVNSLLSKAFIPDNANDQTRYLENVGRYLATQHDSQFIVFGAIQDISLFEQVKNQVFTDDILLRRNFTLQLSLYDAISGNMLLKKSYHGEATWQYEKNHMVDINNSVFWRSDYGRSVLHTISNAVTDINEILSCQPSLPQVVYHSNDLMLINIGKTHGVKVGDEFEIVNQRLIQAANGKTLPLLLVDNLRSLKVVQVNNKSAILSSEWLSLIDRNQLLNFVRPKFIF